MKSFRYHGIRDENSLLILGSGMGDAFKVNDGIRSVKQTIASPL